MDPATIFIPLAAIGIGVQSWEEDLASKVVLAKDEAAQSLFGRPWDELLPSEAEVVLNWYRPLGELQRQLTYERQHSRAYSTYVDKMTREAGIRTEKRLPIPLQKAMKEAKVGLGPIPYRFGNWQLNENRYRRYQDLIVEQLKVMTPVVTGEKWKRMPLVGRQQVLEEIIRTARAQAKDRLIAELVQQRKRR